MQQTVLRRVGKTAWRHEVYQQDQVDEHVFEFEFAIGFQLHSQVLTQYQRGVMLAMMLMMPDGIFPDGKMMLAMDVNGLTAQLPLRVGQLPPHAETALPPNHACRHRSLTRASLQCSAYKTYQSSCP